MVFPAHQYIAPADYLEIESRADEKHEYFEGRVYDMAGASLDHNVIASNLMQKIGAYLDGKDCSLFGSDLRVTTPQFDSFMYPDFSIVCDELQVADGTTDVVTNPAVIIEIMSPSTRGYDMAFKFYYYKQIPSLREYILIDATRCFVQVNRRQDDGTWSSAEVTDLSLSFHIQATGMDVLMADAYRKVSFTRNTI